jgi:hypothetical protein
MSSFRTHFVRFLPLFALVTAAGSFLPRDVSAETITQTKPFSGLSSGSVSLTWDQFNPAVGTLTGISLTINGTASGSFNVFNTDSVDPANLSNPKNRLRLTFSGSGAPAVQQTTQTTMTTSPGMPYQLSSGSSASFNLSPDPQFIGSVTNSLFASASYFTGLGTLSSSLVQPFTLTSDNSGNTTVDYNSLSASGYVEVVYTYQAVPEPSTYAMALAGLAYGSYSLFRRRKPA